MSALDNLIMASDDQQKTSVKDPRANDPFFDMILANVAQSQQEKESDGDNLLVSFG